MIDKFDAISKQQKKTSSSKTYLDMSTQISISISIRKTSTIHVPPHATFDTKLWSAFIVSIALSFLILISPSLQFSRWKYLCVKEIVSSVICYRVTHWCSKELVLFTDNEINQLLLSYRHSSFQAWNRKPFHFPSNSLNFHFEPKARLDYLNGWVMDEFKWVSW
jgi:hypothetical protein